MKKFLFIVPLTPSDYLTPLRAELFKLFLAALKKQKYSNWEALLIGEEEKKDGNILYVSSSGRTKEEKMIYAYEYISSLTEKPDYIIRLDDDDLISANVLERVARISVDFDCYADEYHCYYDVVSGKICQVKNTWLPNTVVHRTEHALAKSPAGNAALLSQDHSGWIKYYRDKKITYANKSTPIYLRIMSPTSGSSKMRSLKRNEFSEEDLQQYWRNIEKVGYWEYQDFFDFKEAIIELRNIWQRIGGRTINIPTNKTISNLINRIVTVANNIFH